MSDLIMTYLQANNENVLITSASQVEVKEGYLDQHTLTWFWGICARRGGWGLVPKLEFELGRAILSLFQLIG